MMSYEEIHTAVAHGESLPPFRTLPEKLCCECLVNLKHAFENGRMDEHQVRVGKQDIRRAYAEDSESYQQYMAVYREYNDNSGKAGGCIREILQGLKQDNPDYEALFQLAMDCIGRLCNDTVTPMLAKTMSNRTERA